MSIESQMALSPDKRYTVLLEEVKSTGKIWILTDEHGCVMLNSEDEDCVPVWPSQIAAQYWATGDWAECKPQAIALEDWLERWTNGLEGDELNVAIYPNPDEAGLILFPDVFDEDLRKS